MTEVLHFFEPISAKTWTSRQPSIEHTQKIAINPTAEQNIFLQTIFYCDSSFLA